MEIVLRKKISYSLTYIIIIVGIIYPLRYAPNTFLLAIGGLGAVIWFVQIITNLIKRDYIIFDGEQVTIKDGFRKWTFSQTDIDYVVINYTPFTNTYFKLKNGKKRPFDPWWLNKEDTDKLHLICSRIEFK
ncbi:hypothetical protein [Pontibacter populi]|uniref:PH domain-containing protein n=1 Tax=Pontibacter populi TaxID=890055 RepID=A0ABV1RXI3_9BACT